MERSKPLQELQMKKGFVVIFLSQNAKNVKFQMAKPQKTLDKNTKANLRSGCWFRDITYRKVKHASPSLASALFLIVCFFVF